MRGVGKTCLWPWCLDSCPPRPPCSTRGWWLRSSVPESKLISHPAPARPSLAVGLFGVRAGEHARGATDTAHIPLGPGSKTVPAGFSGQSRPNPIYGSSIEMLSYFPVAGALPRARFRWSATIARPRRYAANVPGTEQRPALASRNYMRVTRGQGSTMAAPYAAPVTIGEVENQ